MRPRGVRLIRALAAAILLLALLIGWPMLLVEWTRRLLPDQAPSRADWEMLVQQPVTPTTVQVIVVVLLWAGWGWLATAVLRDIARRLVAATSQVATAAGRARLPRPAPGGMVQTIAGGLVGTVVIGLSSSTAYATPTTTADPTPPMGPTATASHSSIAPTPTTTSTVEADADVAEGVVGVPLRSGGWAGAELITAVAGLAAGWWLHRRRWYRPGPPDPNRPDPDLIPLPTPVAALLTTDIEDISASALVATGQGVRALPTGGVGLSGPG